MQDYISKKYAKGGPDQEFGWDEYFATAGGDWFYCREEFGEEYSVSKDKRIFLHVPSPVSERSLMTFIHRLEVVVGTGRFSKFFTRYRDYWNEKVNEDVVVVQPTRFWLTHPLKWSFLTAAIKGFIVDFHYRKVRFNSAKGLLKHLMISPYFEITPYATAKFVNGYTRVTIPRKFKSLGYSLREWVDTMRRWNNADYHSVIGASLFNLQESEKDHERRIDQMLKKPK